MLVFPCLFLRSAATVINGSYLPHGLLSRFWAAILFSIVLCFVVANIVYGGFSPILAPLGWSGYPVYCSTHYICHSSKLVYHLFSKIMNE